MKFFTYLALTGVISATHIKTHGDQKDSKNLWKFLREQAKEEDTGRAAPIDLGLKGMCPCERGQDGNAVGVQQPPRMAKGERGIYRRDVSEAEEDKGVPPPRF